MITSPDPIAYLDISTTEDILVELVSDVSISGSYVGREFVTTIPKGFQTNFGSIPKGFRWLISNTGIYNDSYLLHDWMYSKDYNGPEMSKEDADTLLFLNLKSAGMSRWKCSLVYNVVKLFAQSHWKT